MELRNFKKDLLNDIKNENLNCPGCYILYKGNEVCRLGNIDPLGILYIGKADNLASRIKSLYNSILLNSDHHQAITNERGHKSLSRKFFRIRSRINVEELQFTTIVMKENYSLQLESYLLELYVKKYAELPPLNGNYGSFSLDTSFEALTKINFNFDRIDSFLYPS